MQRDRLELGPEASDYEVISTAHASYFATDKNEAAGLARAAETQKARALACAVSEELQKAQGVGLPLTCIGGLELTQKDIADVLERCEQLGTSSSAAVDYVDAKLHDCQNAHDDDLFTTPAEPLSAATATAAATAAGGGQKPATIAERVASARVSIFENRERQQALHAKRFQAAADRIERELAAMAAFRSRIGSAPRDFSAEIAEIQRELAALKAHRALAAGDSVPDGIDDDTEYVGIAVGGSGSGVDDDDAVAAGPEGERAPAARKLSRAEQRRAARQKAKGKGREE